MTLQEIMTKEVKTCRVWESLNHAAKLMWDNSCGCVPVVDEDFKVVGMLTDRDICMAAYTQGKVLWDIPVRIAMSKVLHTVGIKENVSVAEGIMKTNRVHRLPVVDEERRLVGIISIDDLAKTAVHQKEAMTREVREAEVGRTLAGICERPKAPAARTVKPQASAVRPQASAIRPGQN